ncbi:MAG: hypothetical protein QM729_17130 [Solirubrobacterales bacterium]
MSVTVGIEAYERLADIAEAELAACHGERIEDLAELYAEAERIRAALIPGKAPADAAPALRRAAAAQQQIGEVLTARLADRGNEIGRLQTARQAARAYATTADARARG